MESLTQREEQVLKLIIEGQSTKQIAMSLGMAFKTAACHRYRIMDKVGASNTADLVRRTIVAMRPTPKLDDLRELVAVTCRQSRERRHILRAEMEAAETLRNEGKALRDDVKSACQELRERSRKLLEAGHYRP